ncbi:iron ABC transporter permease [Helicobacter sp. 11S03491-1]|uniref:FecCD family ABC transporter permease n=1 Tax=Helicobacter sp. 11S03491-1 TaxID=1476196 RepID=UPI000BA538F2|nr:iron ABC transporter permease [Helicobacter sp. 11S03491-1]PAF43434.1 iron ABC transporter permease [Helicobacter sp. 11S03491-1]
MRNILLIFILLGICFLSFGVGRYAIDYATLFKIFKTLLSSSAIEDTIRAKVVFNFRAPRIALAVFVGAGLAITGACFQSIFKNPLATPDILGVSSGASFGAVLGLFFGFGSYGLIGSSLVFGFLALSITILIAKNTYEYGTIMLVLGGIIVSALFQSLLALIKYVADPQDILPMITYWLLGSLQTSSFSEISLGMGGIFLGCGIIYLLRWKLNILALEDDEAKSLGISLYTYRLIFIVTSTLITACIVSMCGLIGWIGLLIPHIARLMCGSENTKIIPLSVLLGSIFLVLIDTLSRTISADEIPISILSALIGTPFFIYILKKNKGITL